MTDNITRTHHRSNRKLIGQGIGNTIAGVVVMFVVLLTTVFVDLIIAVAIGMTMAYVILLKRRSDLQLFNINIHHSVDEETPVTREESEILISSDGHIPLYHIGGPVSFSAAEEMVKMLEYQEDYRVLVLDMSNVPVLDYTASYAIKDMIVSTHEAG